MDYDRIYGEHGLDTKYFYSDYRGSKMVVGRINLTNAIARLKMDEHYVLVTYTEGEKLPEQYVPLSGLKSDDGTLFATLNPNTRLNYICRKGGIQMISRLFDLSSGSPNYLLGPGPDEVSLESLVMEQYEAYNKSKTQNQTDSTRRGR